MKQAVEDDTVQFSVKGLTEGYCIFFYPVNTDVQLCFEGCFAGGRKIKSDDVCIVIVLEKISVNPEQMLIAAKNDIERTQWSLGGFGCTCQK